MKKNLPSLTVLLFISIVWELLCQTHVLPPYLVPAPSKVLFSIWVDSGEFLAAFSTTGLSALIGFLLSAFLGLAISIALSSSRLLRDAFYPFAVFFQTVPIIAIAPLLVIWFGYGMPSVVASAFIVSIFPMIATSFAGFATVDANLLDLFKLYGANRTQTLFKLVLPYSAPHIFSGLRIVAGLAVIGTIVGEFMGGSGLGNIIEISRSQQRIDKVFACVLLASLLGVLAITVVDFLSRMLLKPWQREKKTFF